MVECVMSHLAMHVRSRSPRYVAELSTSSAGDRYVAELGARVLQVIVLSYPKV